jgi:SAM-dependent methyltransferase
MNQNENARETVLKASRAYYSHLAYYEDLLAQRPSARSKTRREIEFLEFTFRTHATHRVSEVLDVACGNGRHIIELAHKGYRCTGLDYTSERVGTAEARAKSEKVSVKLIQGDATRLKYDNEFDAVLALYILFLLPDDDDVSKCLRQGYKALRSGGILVCDTYNPLSEPARTRLEGYHVQEARVHNMRYLNVDRVQDLDPVHGVTWWQEISVTDAPDGIHVFRERERMRLFTCWDILHYLQEAGFEEIVCYPDWKTKPPRKPKAERLVFVSRKD